VQNDAAFDARRSLLMALAAAHRIPAIYHIREFPVEGGLMSYGWSIREQYRRAAGYVDKILRGAKPGDLPVEQPTALELVLNIKTAKVLGLTFPREMLVLADRVIE